ncbi:hypothetical protein EIP91_007193 [Steccherinum ochraceum]|uniref:Uncharacterized protein n=1 Tax=Steccherinum ochraceum TaxID=92696 RepID=A0A4R0RIV6_9APHY|nr:hypothetical protein EIP91_007193 [Steccherinum ochraceum]
MSLGKPIHPLQNLWIMWFGRDYGLLADNKVAYKASAYLEQLLHRGAILPEESAELDTVYAEYAPKSTPPPQAPSAALESSKPADLDSDASSTSTSSSPSSEPKTTSDPPPEGTLLLTREAVPALTKALDLGSGFASEMYRALEQARLRLDKKKTGSSS